MAFEIENGVLKAYRPEWGEKTITIPEDVTTIGTFAFQECWELKEVIIPEGVERIEDFAFVEAIGLTNISVPASVKHIGKRAFFTKIALSEQNPFYEMIDNVIYERNPKKLICGMGGVPDIVFVPEGVVSIEDFAFEDCNSMREIHIPASVTHIGRRAFHYVTTICLDKHHPAYTVKNGTLYDKDMQTLLYSCGTSFSENQGIRIPKTVTRIEDFAFRRCSSVRTIKVPSTVKHIGNFVFWPEIPVSIICDNIHFGVVEQFVMKHYMSEKEHAAFLFHTKSEEFSEDEQQIGVEHMEQVHLLNAVMHIVINREFDFFCPAYLRYQVMSKLLHAYPHDKDIISGCQKYLLDFFPFMAEEANGDVSALEKFLHSNKLLTKENIDPIIIWTINVRQTDLQLMLTDYKNKYIGYDSDEDVIRRKFQL